MWTMCVITVILFERRSRWLFVFSVFFLGGAWCFVVCGRAATGWNGGVEMFFMPICIGSIPYVAGTFEFFVFVFCLLVYYFK